MDISIELKHDERQQAQHNNKGHIAFMLVLSGTKLIWGMGVARVPKWRYHVHMILNEDAMVVDDDCRSTGVPRTGTSPDMEYGEIATIWSTQTRKSYVLFCFVCR